jgi:hypothetical protein
VFEKLIEIRHKYLTICKLSCECNRWRVEFLLERPSSLTQSILVAMERWSLDHRAFAVESYFKNDSVVVTQRIFRRHFNIHRNDSVPSRNTVLLWVRNFRETKDNGGLETEHQGRSGSNYSKHAATSDAELPDTLAGMC